jgi:hypothetical protein
MMKLAQTIFLSYLQVPLVPLSSLFPSGVDKCLPNSWKLIF